jgi:predicted DCC family thiol-disulfide oxidoreductase YuxK
MGPSDKIGGTENLILFDGVCNLCNASVKFIIKRDRRDKFYFASLQSLFGKSQLKKFGLNTDEFFSVVLIKQDKAFLRSDAAIEIARDLSGLWPLLYYLKIIPAFIRDFFYNLISKNRYRLFGKQDSCMLPTAEMKTKFIED